MVGLRSRSTGIGLIDTAGGVSSAGPPKIKSSGGTEKALPGVPDLSLLDGAPRSSLSLLSPPLRCFSFPVTDTSGMGIRKLHTLFGGI